MKQKNLEDVTFQVTVSRLTLSSPLLRKQDMRVTIGVGDTSKITCSGDISEDGLTVTWDHPFLFTAPPSMNIEVAVFNLPEELSPEWDKQPFGHQMITDVVSLLDCNEWHCNIPGLSRGSAILSIVGMGSSMLNIPDEHDCLEDLVAYGWKLHNFGRKSKNVACVFTNIEVELAKLDLCPLGHANHTTLLNNLGVTLQFCYNQGGNISDLNRAIEIKQRMLDLCPLGHPNHARALEALSSSLLCQYDIQKNRKDLDRVVEMRKRVLALYPPDHSRYPAALGDLALSFRKCYNAKGDIQDLNKAIEMGENVLNLLSKGDLGYGAALNNLAVSIFARYTAQDNLADLDEAIKLREKSFKWHSSNHPEYSIVLRTLALSLKHRYIKMQNSCDLIRAVRLLKKALNAIPTQHHGFPLTVYQLAAIILLPFKSERPHNSSQPLPTLDEAFQTYALLKRCGPAASWDLLNATKGWVKDAEKYNHPSVLEAYQTSINTLHHFTSLDSSLDSRHEAMQSRVADLANNAFSCATRHDNLQMAVELLEQGRGILWNQLARFDISIATLESQGDQGRELGRNLTRLSADLRKHAQRSEGNIDSYWRVQKEWQSVVDNIRRLEGFSQFLLPPRFDDLQHAAKGGPVIIVNASNYTCDALIVLHNRSPVHVSLPCSLEDVKQLCIQLSELTRDAHAYGNKREYYVKEVLRELWSSVVEPIASILQNDVRLPQGSRIWWCPTSKFTLLPFHAAGPHRQVGKNLMDIYVSSYAPSLSALVRTRERIRSQRKTRAGSANTISFAAVGQARPTTDTNLPELPEVAHELSRIRDETPPNVSFEIVTGEEATIEGAVHAFRDHRWVHVACHGAQHTEKPFESWFAMGDGKLTLMRIIQERYTNSEFAFLSACHTAVGDESTPDEVLHLAAGMQFAGFNGVIGTLWRVDDAVAHQVVTRFYMEMFKRPNIGFEHAAAALNTAVVETADEVSLEKRIVFVHIGI